MNEPEIIKEYERSLRRTKILHGSALLFSLP
jgi:hypothetical protein